MIGHRTQNIVFNEREISSLLSERLSLEESLLGSLTRIRKGETKFEDLDVNADETSIFPGYDAGHFDLKPKDFVDEIEKNKARYKITPMTDPVRVAAVDVSSVKLGAVEKGVLTAFRGCLVWKDDEKYHFYRYGPIISFVEELSFWDEEADQSKNMGVEAFFGTRAVSIMRNRFERILQKAAVDVFKDSIILFDGSLTAGTPDNPAGVLKEIIGAAWSNDNMVIGVSKETKVLAGEKKVTALIEDGADACVICLDDYMRERFPTHPIHLLGRVYVAKMAREGFTFRLDISTPGGVELDLRAVRLLAGNDLCGHGYPETLRLAHILSSFTSNEILGMRRYMSLNFRVEFKDEFDVRRILFGPFSS